MRRSENLNELAAALSKAQAEMGPALKNKTNPFFKSSYADLEAIWTATRGPLSKNGLSVAQVPDLVDGQLILETTLLHSSGQWLSGIYPINPIKNDPQGIGSAVSYSRRYSLAAIAGITTDDDDDGEAANGRSKQSGSPKPINAVATPPNAKSGHSEQAPRPSQADFAKTNPNYHDEPATISQLNKLRAMANALGWSEVELKTMIKTKGIPREMKGLTKGDINALFPMLDLELSRGKK